MRIALVLLSLLAGVFQVHAADAPATPVAKQESVGIAPVKVPDSLVKQVAASGRANELGTFRSALEEQLSAAINAGRKLKVVTRSDLDTVVKEQDLAASRNLDLDDPNLARRFKLAGAGNILQVTLDDYQDRVQTFRSEVLGQTITKRTVRVSAVAKLIDSTTGVVRETVTISPVTDRDLDPKLVQVYDTAESGDQLIPALANMVAQRVSLRLTEVMYPARVLSRSGETVLINRGDGTGIATGQVWSIYADTGALIDPDTGENLGSDEVFIGSVEITDIQPKFSRAKVIKDQGIARGQIARQAKASSQIPSTGK
jgi:hypothetical protein